jgi:hypothetical protein
MTLIRTEPQSNTGSSTSVHVGQPVPLADGDAPLELTRAPSVEQTVRAWHNVGHSQRAIARELNLDRRKVKRIIDQTT